MNGIRSIDLAPRDRLDPHDAVRTHSWSWTRGRTRGRRHSWTRSRTRIASTVAFALAIALAGVASAEPFAYDLSSELMSPFCPGRTLASCPSPQAAELVQWMVVQEAGGATREQVIAMLIEDYGEEILGAPPATGITLWAYVFPVLGFMLGGVIAFFVLRRIVGGAAATPADTPGLPLAASSASSAAGTSDTPDATSSGGQGGASPAPSVSDRDQDDLAAIVDAELAFRD